MTTSQVYFCSQIFLNILASDIPILWILREKICLPILKLAVVSTGNKLNLRMSKIPTTTKVHSCLWEAKGLLPTGCPASTQLSIRWAGQPGFLCFPQNLQPASHPQTSDLTSHPPVLCPLSFSLSSLLFLLLGVVQHFPKVPKFISRPQILPVCPLTSYPLSLYVLICPPSYFCPPVISVSFSHNFLPSCLLSS